MESGRGWLSHVTINTYSHVPQRYFTEHAEINSLIRLQVPPIKNFVACIGLPPLGWTRFTLSSGLLEMMGLVKPKRLQFSKQVAQTFTIFVSKRGTAQHQELILQDGQVAESRDGDEFLLEAVIN